MLNGKLDVSNEFEVFFEFGRANLVGMGIVVFLRDANGFEHKENPLVFILLVDDIVGNLLEEIAAPRLLFALDTYWRISTFQVQPTNHI